MLVQNLEVMSRDCFWQYTRAAEYESKEEERVRWLFIGILEVVEVWTYS